MAKKRKAWRVKPAFDGRVALESQESIVVLSNKLPPEQLAQLASEPGVMLFLERITVTEPTDGQ